MALLWFSTRREDPLSNGRRGANISEGDPPMIRKIGITPASPNLQSILQVEIETDPPAPAAGGEGPFRYRWFVNKKEVGRERFLFLGRFRSGDVVSVEVTAREERPGSRPSPPATAQVVIGNNPPTVKTVRLLPIPVSAGEAVRAEVTAEDPDGDFVSLSYEWQINGQPILGNDRDRLEGDQVKSADKIMVSVTPSDTLSHGIPVLSPLLTVLNRPPEIVSNPSSREEKGRYTYQIVAKDPDDDLLHYLILKGPPGMQIDPASGRIDWQSAPLPGDRADVAVEVNDAKGGRAIQQFTIQMTPSR